MGDVVKSLEGDPFRESCVPKNRDHVFIRATLITTSADSEGG
jgi:hypothetical protein